MTERVFVPVQLNELVTLRDTGRLPGPRGAHAVTAGLRAEWPEGGQDQWEWAALHAAADRCRALGTDEASGRRAVIAADVNDDALDASPGLGPAIDADPTAVRLAVDLSLRDVAAVHVDLNEAQSGDEELAWFATQELAEVVAALSDNSGI